MVREFKFTDGRRLPVGTMYCIARNYRKHAEELGNKVPESPLIFIKPPAAYIEDGGVVKPPAISRLVHHEVELVVVIGKECSHIDRTEALNYIAGYAIGIDVTLRDVQRKAMAEGTPWAISKAFATSAPISKVVPIEKFDTPIPFFDLSLKVNGELRQQSSTKEMDHPVAELVEFIAGIFTLQPGDCIFTGTPEGVGEIKTGDTLFAELKGWTSVEVSVG